ncbi:MAG TPA: lysophospholipid acyltransferase family protein [Gemmatimonadaceae bacterium]
MRTPLVALTALVMTALLGPTVMVAKLLGVKQGPNSIYARCIRLWARSMNAAAGIRIRVHGSTSVDSAHGTVFVANHVSWYDIFALAAEVPWCSFVAKSELRKIPLFGFAAECVGIIFIDRENRKSAFESYRVAAAEVQRGRAVIVCPEGTRGYDYHLRPFKKGPFVLAIAAQAPIVPTVVYGTREVMRKGSFWIRAGTVDLHFLEPVATAGCDYDHRGEIMTAVWSRMAAELRERYGVTTSETSIAAAGVRKE